MTDEELIAYLRLQGLDKDIAAADRIEALVKQCEGLMQAAMNNGQALILAEARAERLEVAMREIAKPYAADQSRLIHSDAQIASIARAALKGADHE